jgi:glycosyltransferase involved in cell wall biosynthesis
MVQTTVASSATKIIVPSEYLKKVVTAWNLKDTKIAEKISVIYNSAEIETLPTLVPSRTAHQIITVGRLVPWKGMHALIRAVAEVQKEIPDASLVIVGEGPEKESLEKLAEELLPAKSVFFRGALTHAQTLDAISSAEIFVLNSTYEGLSHTVIEAMALGSAIIVSDAGGNPELIKDGEDGIVIPSRCSNAPEENISALTTAISQLMHDSDFRLKLSGAARESAKRFTVHAMIEKTAALLSLVGTHTHE